MDSRTFFTCLVIACAVAGHGCAIDGRDREFDAVAGQFGSAYLQSTFTPLMTLFFEREGRWPKNWDELGLTAQFQSEPRLQAFTSAMTFEVLADGSLQINGLYDKRVPIRFQIPVPRRAIEPVNAPAPASALTPDRGPSESSAK